MLGVAAFTPLPSSPQRIVRRIARTPCTVRLPNDGFNPLSRTRTLSLPSRDDSSPARLQHHPFDHRVLSRWGATVLRRISPEPKSMNTSLLSRAPWSDRDAHGRPGDRRNTQCGGPCSFFASAARCRGRVRIPSSASPRRRQRRRVASDGAVSVLIRMAASSSTRSGPGEFQSAAGHGLLGDTLWIRNWPTPNLAVSQERAHQDIADALRHILAPTGITGFLRSGRAYAYPTENALGSECACCRRRCTCGYDGERLESGRLVHPWCGHVRSRRFGQPSRALVPTSVAAAWSSRTPGTRSPPDLSDGQSTGAN